MPATKREIKSISMASSWLNKSKAAISAVSVTSTWRPAITIAACLLLSCALIPSAQSLANCPNGCQCNDETLVVRCGEGTLDVLPIALNPSIQRLVIKSNKIKTIDSSIQFYAELTFLDLSYNDLVTIPQRTFGYQRKLQELHLNHNKIGTISNKTFIGLVSVTVLNLRGNLIAELEEGTFSPLVKIEELDLGQNRISRISPHAFDGMVNLRRLFLDDNVLATVPAPTTFQIMSNLAELFLGTNSFMTIPSGAFENLKGLTLLDLRGAGLHNISAEALKGLDDLRQLDLADNRMLKLPTAAFVHLDRLEKLSLGQNDFEVIPAGAFSGLKNLRKLEITGAQRLRRVDNGAFTGNTNLEHLNLSANKMLSEIQENAFDGLPNLRHVILKENRLNTLAKGLFPWDELDSFDLSENPIVCDCRVLWLRNLLVSKNATNEQVLNVVCASPDRVRETPLSQLSPPLLGCTHGDPKSQAIIGVLLVTIAATITALALILYAFRRKIRELLTGGWGNSALGRKEREYQKTFSDEDHMTRQMPCTFGVNPSGLCQPNSSYSPHQTEYVGSRPIPVTEL